MRKSLSGLLISLATLGQIGGAEYLEATDALRGIVRYGWQHRVHQHVAAHGGEYVQHGDVTQVHQPIQKHTTTVLKAILDAAIAKGEAQIVEQMPNRFFTHKSGEEGRWQLMEWNMESNASQVC